MEDKVLTDKYGKPLPIPQQDPRDLIVSEPSVVEQAEMAYRRFRGNFSRKPRKKFGNMPLHPIRVVK